MKKEKIWRRRTGQESLTSARHIEGKEDKGTTY